MVGEASEDLEAALERPDPGVCIVCTFGLLLKDYDGSAMVSHRTLQLNASLCSPFRYGNRERFQMSPLEIIAKIRALFITAAYFLRNRYL